MRVRINNKKVLMVLLIILLLIIAVGYAVFSETLTISGTANAKGTFDLEFQNAEIVKNIGADVEKTTAEISVDKNTLTVNVADLAYPRAPEFDILIKSHNEKHNTNLNTDPKIEGDFWLDRTDKLYVPHTSLYNEVSLYWLNVAGSYPNTTDYMWDVCLGLVSTNGYVSAHGGVRPVVKIPGTVIGIVGETVEIK